MSGVVTIAEPIPAVPSLSLLSLSHERSEVESSLLKLSSALSDGESSMQSWAMLVGNGFSVHDLVMGLDIRKTNGIWHSSGYTCADSPPSSLSLRLRLGMDITITPTAYITYASAWTEPIIAPVTHTTPTPTHTTPIPRPGIAS